MLMQEGTSKMDREITRHVCRLDSIDFEREKSSNSIISILLFDNLVGLILKSNSIWSDQIQFILAWVGLVFSFFKTNILKKKTK